MTSEPDVTREGKGRARPGPSPSAPNRSRPRPQARPAGSPWVTALGFVVVLFATAAWSVLGTQAHQRSSPAALAVVAAIGAFAGIVLAVGLRPTRARAVWDWLVPLGVGAGGLAVSPWLVMANRYTDAPPGSEVLFFTTVAWGAMLALALALGSQERISRIGGTVLAAVGGATLLANWERPSSFSPLVRYAREEIIMLAAGALWVALILVLLRAARRGTLAVSALAAALGGLVGAGVIALVAANAGALSSAHFNAGVVSYGVAVGLGVAGAMVVLRSGRAVPVAAAYLLVPAAVSLLLAAEWAYGPFGPQPMLLGPVVAGAITTLAGIVLLWPSSSRPSGPAGGGTGMRRTLAVTLGAVAVACAAVALTQPALSALVRGLRTDGSQFRATFDLFGYEAAGAWIAVAAALAALGVALEGAAVATSWFRGLAVAGASVTWWVAGLTPLRTLTSFIPSDVQVDYGSEFARIDFSGTPSLWAAAALGGALLAIALTWVGRASTRPAGDDPAPAAESDRPAHRSRGDRS